MSATIDALYPAHFAERTALATDALAAAGYDHLLIYSGTANDYFRDDHGPTFIANPQLKAWLPLSNLPECWLLLTPGSTPRLTYFQPADYWHLPPADPEGAWTSHVDINITSDPAAPEDLIAGLTGVALLGDLEPGKTPANATLNPTAVTHYLDYHRAYKTAYEIECMAEASRLGVAGHRAAAHAFNQGASEFEIHMRYCEAVGQRENELPYGNIIALNEHGAVLHYQALETTPPANRRSFLIDAGANFRGYASDITRTYAADAGDFKDLIEGLDAAQKHLGDQARAGVNFTDLHLAAHTSIAQLLNEADVVQMDPHECVASGVSSTFLPHGLGHLLGLQVHDRGGLQGDIEGSEIPRPQGHPYLRLTRRLDSNQVLTIEPGLYFIDMLLEPLSQGPHAKHINWSRVEELKPYGGVRIEDNVVVTEDAPRNLTREAFGS